MINYYYYYFSCNVMCLVSLGLVTRLRQPPSFGAAPVAAFGHGRYCIQSGQTANDSSC